MWSYCECYVSIKDPPKRNKPINSCVPQGRQRIEIICTIQLLTCSTKARTKPDLLSCNLNEKDFGSICIYIYVHVHVEIHIHIYVYIYVYIYIYMHIHICIYIDIYVCICIHICMYIHISTYICVCINKYACILHTHHILPHNILASMLTIFQFWTKFSTIFLVDLRAIVSCITILFWE